MENFYKFIFLSRGQLDSLSFDKFSLTVSELLLCYEFFFFGGGGGVSLFLPLLLVCSAKTVLNMQKFERGFLAQIF